jgi:hypothetical protein
MDNLDRRMLLAGLGLVGAAAAASASAGTLTPPTGPVAPTGKTTDQIEPRTPIASVPFTINVSGSYYLTGNLQVASGTAITISADEVSLDLNGFTLSSTASPDSGDAITINSIRKNVVIRNGHIRGTTTFAAGVFTNGGFSRGIRSNSVLNANILVSHVSILGIAQDGIQLSGTNIASLVVDHCVASVCGDEGIRAGTIRDCIAETTGNNAIFADCAINCTGDTVSIMAGSIGVSGLSVVQNCIGTSVSGNGVQGQQVSNSFGTSISGNGLNATNAINCQGVTTSGANGINIAAGGSATFCRGRRDGGVAISVPNGNAIGCGVIGTGTVNSPNKFLGTP